MTRSLRGRRALLILPLVAVLLAGCTSTSSTAATVGDGEISVEQLQADIALFGFFTGLSGAPCGTPVERESQNAACARFTLANDIREELAKAYAAEHDLSIPAADVTDAIAQLEGNLGGPDVLRAQLSNAGLTHADVESLAARLLLVNAVQEAVAGERLDDAALRAAYEADLGTFTTVDVSHILVADRADAERIAAEVTPKTFAGFAKRESIDTGSAAKGGSLGAFSESGFQSQFDADFVQATLALQPGEISAPVHTQFGWHVIYLAHRDVAPFADVRDQLRARDAGQVFEDWFLERLKATDVEVNPRFGRLDTKTGEVLPVRSTQDEPAATGPSSPTGP